MPVPSGLFVALLAIAGAPARHAPPAGPKVLIYVDMDGSSGVARPQQVLYPNPEYFASRRFITADLNATIRGLKAGGAGEIVVTDAHGSGNGESPDVLVDRMDKRATFLFRDTEYDPYLDAPDSTYQAIVCIGMHARARSAGFMAHTVTLEPVYTVNGARITESALVAISAARFRIPVIMVAGDDVLRDQIKEELPLAEYAVVKRARSRALADTLPQRDVQAAIERAARAAIEKLGAFTPYSVAPSYRFEIGWQNVRQADLASIIPGAARLDSMTVGYSTPDFPEGYRLSLRMLGMVGMDRLRWMFQVVNDRPDAKAIRRKYVDLLVTNWLEPEKLPKSFGGAGREARREAPVLGRSMNGVDTQPMRPVRYNVAASLDGFIATADGGYDWIPDDPTVDFAAIFAKVDTVLLGRKSFELTQKAAAAPWPIGTRVYVFSTTLRQADHPGIVVVNADAGAVVASLRAETGDGDIWLFGGGELFRSMLQAGQVDHVEVTIVPVLLGDGVPLSPPGAPLTRLNLTGTRRYPSGMVTLSYEVANRAG